MGPMHLTHRGFGEHLFLTCPYLWHWGSHRVFLGGSILITSFNRPISSLWILWERGVFLRSTKKMGKGMYSLISKLSLSGSRVDIVFLPLVTLSTSYPFSVRASATSSSAVSRLSPLMTILYGHSCLSR